jgi:hypothetical protein
LSGYPAARFTRPGGPQEQLPEKGRAVHWRTTPGITSTVASKQISSGVEFKSGLNKMIDGVVECWNASAWSKAR